MIEAGGEEGELYDLVNQREFVNPRSERGNKRGGRLLSVGREGGSGADRQSQEIKGKKKKRDDTLIPLCGHERYSPR